MELAINSFFHRWFAQHPFVYWLLQHPVITLITAAILIILFIRLFVAVYRLITTSIDRLWLWILRSPFWLLKTLFGWEFKSKQKQNSTTVNNYELTTDSTQLETICDRLDTIQQQQQQILQEISRLKQREGQMSQNPLKSLLPESLLNDK